MPISSTSMLIVLFMMSSAFVAASHNSSTSNHTTSANSNSTTNGSKKNGTVLLLHSLDFSPVSEHDTSEAIESRISTWLSQNSATIKLFSIETVRRVFGQDTGPVWNEVVAAWSTVTTSDLRSSQDQHETEQVAYMDVRRVWFFEQSAADSGEQPSNPSPTVPVAPIITTTSSARSILDSRNYIGNVAIFLLVLAVHCVS
jgi:hypothetical protein